MSVYLELTADFNRGRLRTIVCSGQAVVLLRLAIASKDGDWILREDQEALDHVLGELERRGARYRFGAPMDLRWLRGGWSCHLEFPHEGTRVRTDFFTRPPRVSAARLAKLWQEQEGKAPPFTAAADLLLIKQTAREKDWPIVGELARLLTDPADQMRYSRSAKDLLALAAAHPELVVPMVRERPALAALSDGLDRLRIELERERFAAMDADAQRVQRYLAAAAGLQSVWPELERKMAELPLQRAHRLLVDSASACLPTSPTAS